MTATRIRYSMTDGPELRCAHCGEWWAISPEHWDLKNWDRCRACHAERSRLYMAMRRLDADYRKADVAKTRRYRAAIKRLYPEYLRAYDRERRARDRERIRRLRQEQAA